MAPNAGFLHEPKAIWHAGRPLEEDLNMTNCDICGQAIERNELIAHLEACAEGSSVVYHLKTSCLHQMKMTNLESEVTDHFYDLLNGKPIKLPRGVCYYCDFPEDHQMGNCKTVSRAEYMKRIVKKTNITIEWHLSSAQRYLLIGNLGITELKQRHEKEDLYEALEVETPESRPLRTDGNHYPLTLAEQLQAMEQMHREQYDEAKERLRALYEQVGEELNEKRNHHNEIMIGRLATKDRKCPSEEIKFI